MFKRLISLCTASASVVALLLLANSNFVIPHTNNYLSQAAIEPILKPVSLNVLSTELNTAENKQNLLLTHSGCSCSLCVRLASNSNFEV